MSEISKKQYFLKKNLSPPPPSHALPPPHPPPQAKPSSPIGHPKDIHINISIIIKKIYIKDMNIPQTELAMRGSNGVGLEGAMKSVRERSRIPPPIFVVIYGTW